MKQLLISVKERLLTQQQWEVFQTRFDGTKAKENGSHDKTFQMTETALFALLRHKKRFDGTAC
jgi:hypothetical protein